MLDELEAALFMSHEAGCEDECEEQFGTWKSHDVHDVEEDDISTHEQHLLEASGTGGALVTEIATHMESTSPGLVHFPEEVLDEATLAAHAEAQNAKSLKEQEEDELSLAQAPSSDEEEDEAHDPAPSPFVPVP
eukprot:3117394-Karenia_brevis.AAC.1